VRPCTDGAQCSNGVCVNDGTTSLCSQGCSTTTGCPTGFDCLAREHAGVLAAESRRLRHAARPGINDLCYIENPGIRTTRGIRRAGRS